MNLTDSSISAEGSQSSGVEVWDGTFIGTRVAISATGPGDLSSGVYVSGATGQVSLTDSTVESRGAEAHAVFADSLANVTLIRTDISATGHGAHGLHLSDGGSISATNTNVAVTGNGAAAISMARNGTNDIGTILFNGGSLSSTRGPLISVEAGLGSITINRPISLSPGFVGGRPVLASITNNASDTADLDLTINDASGVAGDIEVTGNNNILNATFNRSSWAGDLSALNNTANITLNASRWVGRASNATNIDLNSASLWNITGSSDARLVTNAGRLAFEHVAGNFLTLTTQNFVGSGGILGVNTVLASDNSDSDLLVIDGGTASGTTGIVVTNVGGGGAQTRGDGIRVVDAINGAGTDANAFHLASRAAAGAYEYLLFHGGESDSNDWFLRSHLIEGPTVVTPVYRPELPLYSALPAMGRSLGLAYLGTLHERVGEQMNIKTRPDQDDRFNGAWARVLGESGSNSWSGVLNLHAHDINLAGIQGGLDVYRAEHDNGHRDHLGVYAAYANLNSKISGFALGVDNLDAGTLALNGPAVGAYWTHYTPRGTYLDAVIQWHWFDVDATSDYDARLNTRGYGFTASLEAGHPFAIGEGWQIEPQGQIIYQTISVNNGADAFSSAAWQGDDAVTGRIGARLQYSFDNGDTLWQPYAKVNLWHGFGGEDHVTLGTSPSFESQFGQTSLEVGGGFTARFSDLASLYGYMDHRWSLDGNEDQSVTSGAVGLRFNW
ncbi:MAG: autotransporter outer membrane beta-barrel domain-containing protein [Rhizobiaceae bacterium]|nr:autotransporter outer membrane beta-barrel domain-containing protein [Rhizobiaceae bacterium]